MPVFTDAIALTAASTETIASGVATISQTVVTVAAESSTTDDLDTLTMSNDYIESTDALFVVLQADTGDTITVKHNTGNIKLNSAGDYTLTDAKALLLVYIGSTWYGLDG